MTFWTLALVACTGPPSEDSGSGGFQGVVVGNPGDAKVRFSELASGPAARATARIDRIDLVACDAPDVETVIVDAEVSVEADLDLALPVGTWCHLELWFDGAVTVEDAQPEPGFLQVLGADLGAGLGIDAGGVLIELGPTGWASDQELADPTLWALPADRLRLGSTVRDEATAAVTGAGTVWAAEPTAAPEFVLAVGDDGTGWFSGDRGERWNPGLNTAELADWSVVAAGPGRAAVLASAGESLLTPDGSLSLAGAAPSGLRAAAWGPDRFAAVGAAGAAGWSWDGVVWNEVDTGVLADLVGVAGGDSGFVAVASSGAVLSSATGESWSVVSDLGAAATDVVAGAEGWLAVGEGVWESVDGTLWSPVVGAGVGPWAAVAAADEGYVAVGDGAVLRVVAGVATEHTGTPELRDVTWIDGRFIGLGTGDALFQTDDPSSWTLRSGSQDAEPALQAVVAAPVPL